jgi:hypothetical protein
MRFKSNDRGIKGIILKSVSMPHNNVPVGLYGLYFHETPLKKRFRYAKKSKTSQIILVEWTKVTCKVSWNMQIWFLSSGVLNNFYCSYAEPLLSNNETRYYFYFNFLSGEGRGVKMQLIWQ